MGAVHFIKFYQNIGAAYWFKWSKENLGLVNIRHFFMFEAVSPEWTKKNENLSKVEFFCCFKKVFCFLHF